MEPDNSVWAHAYDKVVSDDPTTHVAIHHEGEPTEHALFLHRAFFAQDVANSPGQAFIK